MFQLSEVLNLIFDSIGILIISRLLILQLIPKYNFLFLAFLLVWFSNVFTVIEGYYFHDFFNILEHSFYFLSSVSFLISVKREILVSQN
ncbi:hypothetical protein EHQ96_13180 [Leptospira levettii]|uniref:Uncharacterized protein n=1 Tax=Leptospira levettii TaxID=2023178 RepID=A0ABY2MTW8_9LEPT|nr:hypothetical protein CH369_11945 [Leptospira levettii]PKA27441.1 hypothetical protein CH381_05610 [Leptospira sp. mixed culture ATI2-C-A1]TGK93091.1 hypothetical protein EHQ34_16495 [Leptospira levettii]TGL03717.1 hypothetical protein EHQ39_17520 [Leptospira levettii]TGL75251.1 hypothetical protein EHQ60_00575 [Leptospira levettii]